MKATTQKTSTKTLAEKDPELYRALRRTAGQPTTVQDNEELRNAERLLSFAAINGPNAEEAPPMVQF
jgi:hypothetical protein